VKEDIRRELTKEKKEHTSEISKIRQQISDKVDALLMDDETKETLLT
jgi:hypothetical protein